MSLLLTSNLLRRNTPTLQPPLKCEICGLRYEYGTDDFESIDEHGVCVDCGKIKFKD